MRSSILLAVLSICVLASIATAAGTPNFSGKWVFNASESTNIGMMAGAQITSTIKQTRKKLTVVDSSVMGGQSQEHEINYDLSGKPVTNQSFMGESSQTTSAWSGDKLVTKWETKGAIAGTRVVRTETRYLSADGKTMFLEYTRGKNPPMVIAFDRR